MNIKQELEEVRIKMIEALDNGDDDLYDEYADIVSDLAKILNSGMSKERYFETLNYEKELNVIPPAIKEQVMSAMADSNLTKEMVNEWNKHLDFDLHSKLKRYGYIGSARLYKIFTLK